VIGALEDALLLCRQRPLRRARNALEAARDVRRRGAGQLRAVVVDVGRAGADVGVFLGDRRAALARRQLRDQQQPWSHARIIAAEERGNRLALSIYGLAARPPISATSFTN